MPLAKIRHTKHQVLVRVEAEYRALDTDVRRLGTRALDAPVQGFGAHARIPRERWTNKDALAHIVEWKRQALRRLRHEAPDPELRGLTIARKNRILYERWHRQTASAVVAYHRKVHGDVIAALNALPEAYFRGTPRSPSWPNELVGHSAAHRLRHLEANVARS